MKIINKKIKDLIDSEYNPRQLSKEQFQQIESSLKRFGIVDPIIINKNKERKNIIIGGHQRVRVAKSLKYKEIPCVELDLTLDKERELNIRLNKNTGAWDFDSLANYFDTSDLLEWGFKEEELSFFELEEDGLIDDDEIPEVTEAITKLGDLWLLGDHRVLCGDSTEIVAVERLMGGNKADMVFTDPPYGIDFKDSKGKTIKNDDLNNDNLLKFNSLWQKICYDICANNSFMLVFQSPRKFYLLNFFGDWVFFRLLTLYKANRISFPHGAWINKTEPCCVFIKGNPKITEENYLDDCYVYNHDKETHQENDVGHPTPKPIKMIIEHITACIKKNKLVLDLFLGSGSTLIACEKTARKCYGMELDPHYCDVIVKRWEEFTGKKAVREEHKEKVI